MKIEFDTIENIDKQLEEYKNKLYSQLEVIKKVYKSYGITYNIWNNIPEEIKISKNNIGCRVWLVGEKEDQSYTVLKKFYEIGDHDSFPNGGIVVNKKGTKYTINKEINQAVLHPDEIDITNEQKLQVQRREEVIEEAKKEKYVNPLTDRKCSYKYGVQKGFITETGKKIPLEEMKFENPNTGRMCSYQYLLNQGLIDKKGNYLN